MYTSLRRFGSELGNDIWQVSTTLFKLMVPTIIVVKILEELGAVDYLATFLGPIMAWVGLPESMGLVWATTILTNIYAGMLVFFYVQQTEVLSVAQVTVLSVLLLLAHGLPVEARIAQQAGVRLRVTLLLRLGGGLLLGWILHQLYTQMNWLQETNQLVWQPQIPEAGLWAWVVNQAKSLLMIQVIIIVLLTCLKILKLLGIERLIGFLLRPILRFLGIGKEATTITIVGVTLGLSFGGGLLIKEARAGHVPQQDIFASMCLLALSHSMIEDTLLVMVLGADLSGVLWARLIFTVVLIGTFTRITVRCSETFWKRHLVNRNIEPLLPNEPSKAGSC
ncbi:nucleoside recognition domain-containing protein [Neptunomonas concharum]|uniref:Nucleoside transporter/FeoB GTPase Gate domain-containing protein n=1 Tax=Neptunomonas concharum TaxID=1031538 RepID=A0A5P1RBZ3_9GAMM|nr:nucleoside recognition domain-containing protein [Neptunomonas concharum]QEQ97138.1 hypothetical protein F0U83_10670 [Neptunomonas concharum]